MNGSACALDLGSSELLVFCFSDFLLSSIHGTHAVTLACDQNLSSLKSISSARTIFSHHTNVQAIGLWAQPAGAEVEGILYILYIISFYMTREKLWCRMAGSLVLGG